MFPLVNLTKVSMAAHSMYFCKSIPTRISTDPGHGTRIDCVFYPYFQGSWKIEAFLLCIVFTATKLSEWSPMERRAPAQGSSRDQHT